MLNLQLLLQLATPAIVIAGFLYNNSRLNNFQLDMGDMRDALRDEIKMTHNTMEAEFKVLRTTMEKNHTELLSKFAGLETRLTRIEEKIR